MSWSRRRGGSLPRVSVLRHGGRHAPAPDSRFWGRGQFTCSFMSLAPVHFQKLSNTF